jgi:hypothetical protein
MRKVYVYRVLETYNGRGGRVGDKGRVMEGIGYGQAFFNI